MAVRSWHVLLVFVGVLAMAIAAVVVPIVGLSKSAHKAIRWGKVDGVFDGYREVRISVANIAGGPSGFQDVYRPAFRYTATEDGRNYTLTVKEWQKLSPDGRWMEGETEPILYNPKLLSEAVPKRRNRMWVTIFASILGAECMFFFVSVLVDRWKSADEQKPQTSDDKNPDNEEDAKDMELGDMHPEAASPTPETVLRGMYDFADLREDLPNNSWVQFEKLVDGPDWVASLACQQVCNLWYGKRKNAPLLWVPLTNDIAWEATVDLRLRCASSKCAIVVFGIGEDKDMSGNVAFTFGPRTWDGVGVGYQSMHMQDYNGSDGQHMVAIESVKRLEASWFRCRITKNTAQDGDGYTFSYREVADDSKRDSVEVDDDRSNWTIVARNKVGTCLTPDAKPPRLCIGLKLGLTPSVPITLEFRRLSIRPSKS